MQQQGHKAREKTKSFTIRSIGMIFHSKATKSGLLSQIFATFVALF